MLKTLTDDDNLLYEAEAFATRQGTSLNTLIENEIKIRRAAAHCHRIW